MANYIYILINPSFAGLLKIGRTGRSPEVRANELSAGTNMPTPFVVAYEEEVSDGQVAERMVHEELTRKGYRVSDSREFFSVPLKVAIKTVSDVASQIKPQDSFSAVFNPEDGDDRESLADYYYKCGKEAVEGSKTVLQDYGFARECFEKSIALGGGAAYFNLALLHIYGRGVRQSVDAALKILKKGGDAGDTSCYQLMWQLYIQDASSSYFHENNAEVSFGLYLDSVSDIFDLTCSLHFCDYLVYGHKKLCEANNLPPSSKFMLHQFSGEHTSRVINIWIEGIKSAFIDIGSARRSGVLFEKIEFDDYGNEHPIAGLFCFDAFVTEHLLDAEAHMRRALLGVAVADFEYISLSVSNPHESLVTYLSYFNHSEDVAVKEKEYLVEKSSANLLVSLLNKVFKQ